MHKVRRFAQAVGLHIGRRATHGVVALEKESGLEVVGRVTIDLPAWMRGSVLDVQAAKADIYRSLLGIGWDGVSPVTYAVGGWETVTHDRTLQYPSTDEAAIPSSSSRMFEIAGELWSGDLRPAGFAWLTHTESAKTEVQAERAWKIEGRFFEVSKRQVLAKLFDDDLCEHMRVEAAAAGEAAVSMDERERGVVLVVLGGKASQVAIWRDGVLVGVEGLLFGTDTLFRDIAYSVDLRVDYVRESCEKWFDSPWGWVRVRFAEEVELFGCLTRTIETVRSGVVKLIEEELWKRGYYIEGLLQSKPIVAGEEVWLLTADLPRELDSEPDKKSWFRSAVLRGIPENEKPIDEASWCVAYGLAQLSRSEVGGGALGHLPLPTKKGSKYGDQS